jgi:hypothetical protein
MAGMDGLGRVFNVITTADTVGFSMKECSAVTLIVKASGASSVAITAAKTFGGSYDNFTTANGFGQTNHWFQTTSATGTAAWTRQTASWSSNSLTLAGTSGYVSAVTIYGSQMADQYNYLKATCTNGTLVVITHDLTVQRKPANLAILGA